MGERLLPIKRTQEQIDVVLNKAQAQVDKGPSKFMGLKYEDGILAMYGWLTEEEEGSNPMEP